MSGWRAFGEVFVTWVSFGTGDPYEDAYCILPLEAEMYMGLVTKVSDMYSLQPA